MLNATDHYEGHGIGIDVHTTLHDAGVVGLWEYRIAERRVYADRAMALFYGVDPDMASVGLSPEVFRAAIHPDDRPLAIAAICDAIESGEEYHVRYRVLAADGSHAWVDVHAKPHQHDGATIRLTGVNILASTAAPSDPVVPTDPMIELADLAMRLTALARSIDRGDITYFSEMLMVEIANTLADRLMENADGHS